MQSPGASANTMHARSIVPGAVPCDGCTRCCHGDAVRLLPEERNRYQTEPHDWYPGERMLAHKPNGDCIYLSATGCSIHDRKPHLCAEMDCRVIAARIGYTQARQMARRNELKLSVWARGRELLKRPTKGG